VNIKLDENLPVRLVSALADTGPRFFDMRRYAPGTHAGRLLVRLSRPGRYALLARVTQVFETENVEDWAGCLVVVTDPKIRVRQPAPPTGR
jgi:hypothetical protein